VSHSSSPSVALPNVARMPCLSRAVGQEHLKHFEAKMQQLQARKEFLISKGHVRSTDEFRSLIQEECYHMLRHWAFDCFCGAIILYNLALVIIETNSAAEDEKAPKWVEISSMAVLVFFIVEMAVRLFVWRWDFILDSCNLFEFALVLVDAVLNAVSAIIGEALPISFLRIIRLTKLARVTKVLRVLPELRVLVGGLSGSLKAIFWGSVLLVLSMLISAIIAVQFIGPLNSRLAEQGIYRTCDRCPRAFSDVSQACLTILLQTIIGEGWSEPNIHIIEHYPATAFYFIVSHMVIGMAVLSLMFGLVVNVAIDQSASLGRQVEQEKLMEQLQSEHQLLEICQEMDKDKDGHLTRKEINDAASENERFKDVLLQMRVGQDDLEVLWAVLNGDESGSVSYTDFVTNCYKLKTSDSHIMLAYINYYVKMMKQEICADISDLKHDLAQEEEKIAQIERQTGEELNELKMMEKTMTQIERQTSPASNGLKMMENNILAPYCGDSFCGPGPKLGCDNLPNVEKQTRCGAQSASGDSAEGAGGKGLDTEIMFEELQALLQSLMVGMNQTLTALGQLNHTNGPPPDQLYLSTREIVPLYQLNHTNGPCTSAVAPVDDQREYSGLSSASIVGVPDQGVPFLVKRISGEGCTDSGTGDTVAERDDSDEFSVGGTDEGSWTTI